MLHFSDESSPPSPVPRKIQFKEFSSIQDRTPKPKENPLFLTAKEHFGFKNRTSSIQKSESNIQANEPVVSCQKQVQQLNVLSGISSATDKVQSALSLVSEVQQVQQTRIYQQLSKFCINPRVIENIHNILGIHELYEWQENALNKYFDMEESSNFLISAQTATGKSIVGDIIVMKLLCEQDVEVIYVEPLVATAQQRYNEILQICDGTGLQVSAKFRQTKKNYTDINYDIHVCVIEKAQQIINNYDEESKLKLVILDEIHYCCQADYRGALYELFASKCLKNDIKIVSFSATIPNIELFTIWLKAELFIHNTRDIQLDIEGVLIQGNIITNNKGEHKEFKKQTAIALFKQVERELQKYDAAFKDMDRLQKAYSPDFLSAILPNNLETKDSVLFFCQSQIQCEVLAVYQALRIKTHQSQKNNLSLLSETSYNSQLTQYVQENLDQQKSSLDNRLAFCLQYGCAFHHGGLSKEQRDQIEFLYKQKQILFIFATSTLSQGVNLPVKYCYIFLHYILWCPSQL
ncbi:DNA_helicase [Hexamita inflata]|uniref:DNA helicase n=1 Tax=Hexamita inflata TaxID=28002 RepID=A0AA86QKD6_9EUKA|nr:DNA helicase [Hexamita inflata]